MKNPIRQVREWFTIRRKARLYDREIEAIEAKQAALKATRNKDPARRKALALAQINTALEQLSAPPPVQKVKLTRAEPPPGVVPPDKLGQVMAMDATPYDWASIETDFQYSFPGYPYLAQLAQVPEYRKMVGRLASEMTRNFVKLKAVGEGDFTDEIAALEEDLKTFRIKDHFRKMTEIGNYFGRAQLYIDVYMPNGTVAAYDNQAELEKALFLHPNKIPKNCLRGFRVVEPLWSYPGVYNSTDPLKPYYYEPQVWFVMGKKVHVSRLLTFIPHPVPDVLKAAYSFGGISLCQLAQPYVNNWLRTRQAVSDIITNFSTCGLATDMSSVLQSAFDDGQSGNGLEPAGDVIKRAQAFANFRTNRGLFVIDKETEEFFQEAAPLGTLDDLQAQAQEQMASVCNMPLVILTGITPKGLNASSDGEIRVWYDHVNAEKGASYSGPMDIVLKVMMLNRFGRIIPEITYEWPALYQLSDDQKAAARKTQADTDVAYITAGVFSPEEIRTARVSDDDGAYNSIKGDNEDENEEDLDHEENDEENEGESDQRTDTRVASGS